MTTLRRRRFVHVGVNPRDTLVGWNQVIENYLNNIAGDWYRYAAQNYVVWTDVDLGILSKGITGQPGLGSLYVLATEFTIGPAGCNGMMPKQFWDWLHQNRS